MAALLVMLIGSLALAGWIVDNEHLKCVIPGWVSMKVNTAIGLLLCSSALALCIPGSLPKRPPIVRHVVRVLSGAAIVLMALTLWQYLFHVDLGIDQMFFRDARSALQTSHPGRMAPTTAFCFVLVGVALFASSLNFPQRIRLSVLKALGVAVAFIGTFAVIGYMTDAVFDIHWWTYTGMAAHTSVCFVLLGTGLFCLAAAEGSFKWFLDSPTTCGFLAGILLIVLAAQTAYIHTNQLLQTSMWVAHRQEVLKEIRQLHSATAHLQSGQRGYIITGNESELNDRRQALENARSSLRKIQRLTANNPNQSKNAQDFEESLNERINWEERTISTRRTDGFPSAAAMISSGAGNALRIHLHEVLTRMENEEFALLASDQESAETAATMAFLLLPLEIFLSLTVLFGSMFFLNTGMEERAAAEGQLRDALKEEQDLRDALDEHAIVAITNPQGKITFVNEKFCAISKYDRRELLGQDHRIINSGHHSKEFFHTLWATIGRGHVWKGEVKNRAKDGTVYWVDTTIVPFLNEKGKPRQYVAIRTDITERKQAEEEIQALNASLEQRVAQRTAELQAANKELDSFCYSVSHDLRAPLRGIGGFSKILMEDYAGRLDETGRDYLKRVEAAADRMSELIDDLLKLSRVTRDDVKLEQVDVSAMAQSIAEGLKQSAPDRHAEFLISGHMEAQADPRLLRVMLENLLNNAWKFTSRKAHARIELTEEVPANGEKIFRVHDNGAGFDMEYAGKLFGPFQRLHAMSDFPGTGIGLATVQRIMHRHGGRVWAEAVLNEGATFYFSLPTHSNLWKTN